MKHWEYMKFLNNRKLSDENDKMTSVDNYWSQHTVNSPCFRTKEESLSYIKELYDMHPFARDYRIYDTDGHKGEIVLDYGCGPGNSLVGFVEYSQAKKIYGLDISNKALELAQQRLRLHEGREASRVELIKIQDSNHKIPLDSKSIDYISCLGVLQHTSKPERILKEFYRISKHGANGTIMVYNQESLWFHLYVAYQKMILENHRGDVNQEFAKWTDGPECPISRCYGINEFILLCEKCGFKAKYQGAYLTEHEIMTYKKYFHQAIKDSRLPKIHREFLSHVYLDQGYPKKDEKYAGVSGMYKITKV